MGIIFLPAFLPKHFEENDPFKYIGDGDFGCPSLWEIIKANWNPNLSKVSNRANILNKWHESRGRKPLYPMLPDGELDAEAFKLMLEKENKKLEEEHKKLEEERKKLEEDLQKAEERAKELAKEVARIAYANSFLGKLDKFLTSMFFRK